MLIEPNNPWWVLVVFVVMHFALLWLFGTTLGKRVFRIQVVQLGGAPIKLYQAAIRAILLCLVIPVLVIDGDSRGLHEKQIGRASCRERVGASVRSVLVVKKGVWR